MPEATPERQLVAPPDAMTASIARAGRVLILRSAFPTVHHLLDAAAAGVLLATGLLLAVLATMARQGRLAALGSEAMAFASLLTAIALILALLALRRLRGVLPLELRLDRSGILLAAPRGVPLAPAELSGRRPPPGGRIAAEWAAVERVERVAEGLLVHIRGRTPVLVPWRYRRAAGWLGSRTGPAAIAAATCPAFRFDELDWLSAVLERYRSGDDGAVDDLRGRLAPGSRQPVPLWEDPPFVLEALAPVRLRVLVVGLALALGLWAASTYGTLPRW